MLVRLYKNGTTETIGFVQTPALPLESHFITYKKKLYVVMGVFFDVGEYNEAKISVAIE